MQHRKNDDDARTWFRSERLFQKAGKWFIRTREGVDVGPFASRTAAETEAGALQTALEGLSRPEDAEATVKGFLLDAQLPADGLGSLTDYVVKEGSF